jgi:hypothetical protein
MPGTPSNFRFTRSRYPLSRFLTATAACCGWFPPVSFAAARRSAGRPSRAAGTAGGAHPARHPHSWMRRSNPPKRRGARKGKRRGRANAPMMASMASVSRSSPRRNACGLLAQLDAARASRCQKASLLLTIASQRRAQGTRHALRPVKGPRAGGRVPRRVPRRGLGYGGPDFWRRWPGEKGHP